MNKVKVLGEGGQRRFRVNPDTITIVASFLTCVAIIIATYALGYATGFNAAIQ